MTSAEDAAKLKRNQVRVASDLGPEILRLLWVDLCERKIIHSRDHFWNRNIRCMRVCALPRTMRAWRGLLLFGLRPAGFSDRTSTALFSPRPSPVARSRVRALQAWVYSATFVSYAMAHFSRKCYTNVKQQLVLNAGMSKALLSRLDTGYVPSAAVVASPNYVFYSSARSPLNNTGLCVERET